MNFFIPIALSILLELLKSGKIPASAVKGLKKLRDALNLAFPPDGEQQGGGVGTHIEIV